MANYPRINPATLANLQPVIDDPTTNEDANKLWEVDLQSRRFTYDFLIRFFDQANGDVLKAAAIADASVAGKVKGSTANSGGAQQSIVQGTVSTPDLRDAAVDNTKLADNAVSAVKIADGSVSTTKLADSSVTTSKLGEQQVTTSKMAADSVTSAILADDAAVDANRAVTTDHVRDVAITTAKIANNAVNPDKLFLAGLAAHILVADANKKFQSVAMSGDATIDSTGKVTISANAVAVVEERATGSGTAAGASVAGAGGFTNLNVRGVAIGWDKTFETVAATVTLPGAGKIQLTAGTYVVEANCPGYSVDEHICRISRYNSLDVLQESFYGTSEIAAVGAQTHTKAKCKVTMAANDYLKVEHWTKTAKAVNGLGLPSSSGTPYERYAQVRIQKVSA